MAKVYKPMDLDAAEDVCYTTLPKDFVLNDMNDAEKLIYAELIKLHHRIDEIENQASEMMSPEKMSELAGSFLGAPGGVMH